MLNSNIYIGNSEIKTEQKAITGDIVEFENESYYKISNYDDMRPFFMSIVSPSNHWMFLSSNGGLTAGRQNAESALFPYYTDDKITEMAHLTGNRTLMQVEREGKNFLWEPFSREYDGIYAISRNLYKNRYGNKIVFEEINEDLGLTYRYHWNSSDIYGFVKRATLCNHNPDPCSLKVLDGIQNIMPYGVNAALQNASSNLVDAYKRNELEAEVGLGIYSLSAIIVDRAEPSEALKATTVWSTGLENATFLVSSLQVEAFKKGEKVIQETDIKAEKGAYFMCADVVLAPNSEKNWLLAAEVNQSMVAVAKLTQEIKEGDALYERVMADVALGTEQLVALNGASDGLQFTRDKLRDTRHFSNTLFNIMRGGIFDDNYTIERSDFLNYLKSANRALYRTKKDKISGYPTTFKVNQLQDWAREDGNPDYIRLAYEYLPLKFSRRHGDPSRPWNKFSINTVAEDGSKILDYEGNWRDIFQNWEALAQAYPEFVDGMIYKFVNATTFDGYNPYRVTKGGFDWETIEPDDPWSYIGYWGDHQIIYLLKLLEFLEAHYPGKLSNYFNQNIFVYANVPYRIKDYKGILADPKDTIMFDVELDEKIRKERQEMGADGALLKSREASIYRVNLMEKFLATVLAKVSNFIPEGGIWMNTQRPEWNDANNALVGNGVSMVTLYYLRRFMDFFKKVLQNDSEEGYSISKETATFFNETKVTLTKNKAICNSRVSNTDRKRIMDALGQAGSDFRDSIYKQGFCGEREELSKADILEFVLTAQIYLEHSIVANKRADNLFHAYNLMTLKNDDEVSISYLSEMLEGQVAALSSGYLSSKQSLALLDALKGSALFRHDQYSYILYPNKELPRFVDKNNIPTNRIEKSALAKQLLKDGNSQIIVKDVKGSYHFNGSFNNADSLKKALDGLPKARYGDLVEKDRKHLLDTFEAVFDHKSFTGRSGTFFGYEGLGSIYWHMVSKLLLAVQETCWKAINDQESEETIGRLLEHYYEINEGIGVHKSPELYGAFPTDPYSHTPAGKGAQQPGMTGQVKEDILCRFGELGVLVENGILSFRPRLLRKEEFLKAPDTFNYTSLEGKRKQLQLEKHSLCFTYCQVPIIYKLSDDTGTLVRFNDGKSLSFNGSALDASTSNKLFKRTNEIEQIIVSIK
jgi:hypothetical protein